jgi:hypothetical protein
MFLKSQTYQEIRRTKPRIKKELEIQAELALENHMELKIQRMARRTAGCSISIPCKTNEYTRHGTVEHSMIYHNLSRNLLVNN